MKYDSRRVFIYELYSGFPSRDAYVSSFFAPISTFKKKKNEEEKPYEGRMNASGVYVAIHRTRTRRVSRVCVIWGIVRFPASEDLVNIERKWPPGARGAGHRRSAARSEGRISGSTPRSDEATRGTGRGGIFLRDVTRSIADVGALIPEKIENREKKMGRREEREKEREREREIRQRSARRERRSRALGRFTRRSPKISNEKIRARARARTSTVAIVNRRCAVNCNGRVVTLVMARGGGKR